MAEQVERENADRQLANQIAGVPLRQLSESLGANAAIDGMSPASSPMNDARIVFSDYSREDAEQIFLMAQQIELCESLGLSESAAYTRKLLTWKTKILKGIDGKWNKTLISRRAVVSMEPHESPPQVPKGIRNRG